MTRHIASVLPRRCWRNLGWLFLLLGGLALAGCYIDSPEDQATARDLNGKSFIFTNGAVFHAALTNVSTTLSFSNNANHFTLTSTGGMASGSHRFGSCILTVAESTYMAEGGPQLGEVITLAPCDFHSADKTLIVGRGSLMATSELPSSPDGETGGRPATVNDLRNQTFAFTNGAVFDPGLAGTPADLTFDSAASTFVLSSPTTGRSASGTHRLASACILTVTTSNYLVGTGPQMNTVITLNPCTFNSTNRTLTISHGGSTETSASVP